MSYSEIYHTYSQYPFGAITFSGGVSVPKSGGSGATLLQSNTFDNEFQPYVSKDLILDHVVKFNNEFHPEINNTLLLENNSFFSVFAPITGSASFTLGTFSEPFYTYMGGVPVKISVKDDSTLPKIQLIFRDKI